MFLYCEATEKRPSKGCWKTVGADVIRLLALQKWLLILSEAEPKCHNVPHGAAVLYRLRAEGTKAVDYMYDCLADMEECRVCMLQACYTC